MLAEFLKYWDGLLAKAQAPVEVPLGDPRLRKFVVDGRVELYPIDPAPRAHAVKHLDDLIALTNRFENDANEPVVWYDESRVVLVIDDDGHRLETATLALETSDVFAVLKALRKGTWFSQKDFVRLLRIDLAGTLAPVVLLDRVRKLKVENGSVVSSEVARQRESMGRTITAAVSGEGEVPDEVLLHAPVYKTAGENDPLPVRCLVEVDPTTLTPFRLLPAPDEIEAVQRIALDSLRDRLRAGLNAAVPAYYGSP